MNEPRFQYFYIYFSIFIGNFLPFSFFYAWCVCGSRLAYYNFYYCFLVQLYYCKMTKINIKDHDSWINNDINLAYQSPTNKIFDQKQEYISERFIKSTDHRPTDHFPLTHRATDHLPSDSLTNHNQLTLKQKTKF